jgi:hypothetical protein
MRMLLGEFNSKAGREDAFKATIGNERLHEISNDNGVIVVVVNFATSKYLILKRKICTNPTSRLSTRHNIRTLVSKSFTNRSKFSRSPAKKRSLSAFCNGKEVPWP